MKHLLIILSFVGLISCTQRKQKKEIKNPEPKLTFLWETDTLLTTVESVIFDVSSNYIYTSNIEGNPRKKDGKGSISKLDLKGNIITRNWVSGLNAPKGMAIYNDKLFVTDIDRLLEIDIPKGEIAKEYPVENAVFLNDIAISKTGIVYFSDTDVSKIFALENNKISLFSEFNSPNGLLVQDDQLLAVSWDNKTFSRIDLVSKKITQIADSIPNPDGIEALGKGTYLVSSWNGMIHHVTKEGTKILLLDTTKEKIFSADIDYIAEKKLVLVPTFFKNKVMAYRYSE